MVDRKFKQTEKVLHSEKIDRSNLETGLARVFARFLKNNPVYSEDDINIKVKLEHCNRNFVDSSFVDTTCIAIVYSTQKETEDEYNKRVEEEESDVMAQFKSSIDVAVDNLVFDLFIDNNSETCELKRKITSDIVKVVKEDIQSFLNETKTSEVRRFKPGDIIVNDETGKVFDVINIIDGEYIIIEHGNDIATFGKIPATQDKYHLWSINDAKDGDILSTHNFVFIFKEINSEGEVKYYCANEKYLHEGDTTTSHVANEYSVMGTISTTEYRLAGWAEINELFTKMKEDGHKFLGPQKGVVEIRK